MLRYSLVFFVLLMFCLPVLPQEAESILPLAYVVEAGDTFDLHIMDAVSGDELYQIAGSCPFEFSPDRHWLIYGPYSSGPYELHSFNLLTGESAYLSDNSMFEKWATDNQRLVYRRFDTDGKSLYLYDLANQTNTLIYEGDFFVLSFQGEFLFFATMEENMIYLHRWNGGDEIIASFVATTETPSRISLSPNRQFLAVEYDNFLLMYTVATTKLLDFGDVMPLFWRPLIPATLVYSMADRTSSYNLLIDEGSEILGASGGRLFWSPDGSYLVELDREDMKTLRIFTIDSGEVLELEQYESYENVTWDWLSDSQFYYAPPLGADRSRDYFLHDMNTGEEHQITNTPEIHEMSGCPQG